MDQLRSLRYFMACAAAGSFSGAARRLEISVPAVAKLVNALERDLGIALFDRSAQGLALTSAGAAYLEACSPAVLALQELDEQVRSSGMRARGTIGVGVQHVAAQAMLLPLLARFHALHPDVRLEVREATQMVGADVPGVDVYVSFSWARNEDMVHRALLQSRFVVCAAPAYWAARGKPRQPQDLAHHDCLLMRTQTGTLMDVWSFERDGVVENVTVNGWLACDNAHRDVALSMGLAGQGVLRLLEWEYPGNLESRGLIPVLADWTSREAPPLHLSYRPSARRLARVRAFIEFMQEAARDMGAPQSRAGPMPRWAGTTIGRASSIVPGRKGRRPQR
jgi:DNA-binding transcriptional LysR family regulator